MKKTSLFLTFLALIGFATVHSQAQQTVNVTAIGVQKDADSTNWLEKFATLHDYPCGVDFSVRGEQEYIDWSWGGSTATGGAQSSQGTLPSPSVLWPVDGSIQPLGYDTGSVTLIIGPQMASHLGAGKSLVISEISTAPGTFVLNGVSIKATAAGQVLSWKAANSQVVSGATLHFTSDSPQQTGPIGFSAETASSPAQAQTK